MNAEDAKISEAVSEATGEAFALGKITPVAGGCINECHLISDGQRSFFIKYNRANWSEMFAAEAEGLRALAGSDTLRVPEVICRGISGSRSFLVLEAIEMFAPDARAQAELGRQLAQMHRKTVGNSPGAGCFGWHRNNTIGSTPQINTPGESWVEFFAQHRLKVQFDLASTKGLSIPHSVELCERLELFFKDGYSPEPSLLHGDLWAGNVAMDREGRPVLFDPACYYGDREADMAFTEMFGGFCESFYQAYRESWPLHAGYSQRKAIYNLYHVLNHFNLFGGGYAAQAQSMVREILN